MSEFKTNQRVKTYDGFTGIVDFQVVFKGTTTVYVKIESNGVEEFCGYLPEELRAITLSEDKNVFLCREISQGTYDFVCRKLGCDLVEFLNRSEDEKNE